MRKLTVAAAAAVLPLLLATSGVSATKPATTLNRTIVASGPRELAPGPGEGRVTRSLGWRNRSGTGRALAGFKQLSDVHIVDAQSPGRVEFIDRCPGLPASGFRPQEAFSAHVGESMIRALNKLRKGPATGVPLGFAVSTGDNIDNNQRNELRWFIDLMNGKTITPDSGEPGYDGYRQEHYVDAVSDELLDLSMQSFEASGVGPWYAVLGNHDELVQGTLPANTLFRVLATQNKKIFFDPERFLAEDRCPQSLLEVEDAFMDLYFSEHAQPVPADTSRGFVDHEDIVQTYSEAEGQPRGHGLRNTPRDPVRSTPERPAPAGYYAFNIAKNVRGISMDTVSYAATSRGILNDSQFRWVEKRLKKSSRVYYTRSGKRRTNPNATNKLIVLFSHHTSRTINEIGLFPNTTDEQKAAMLPQHCFTRTAAPGCAKGEGFRDLLQRYPNVIAWVNGHEHNNRVTGFSAPKGTDAARGFWEINTAAHIDWPQQARLIEIAFKPGADGKPGSVFVYGTIVDHVAAPAPDQATQDTVEYLASVSRVEAYYDACVREGQARCGANGARRDRNVKLVLKAPFDL